LARRPTQNNPFAAKFNVGAYNVVPVLRMDREGAGLSLSLRDGAGAALVKQAKRPTSHSMRAWRKRRQNDVAAIQYGRRVA